MPRSHSYLRWWIILAAGATAGCGGRSDAPRVPLGARPIADSGGAMQAAHSLIGAAARAALDSGNKLFRKKAYAAALVEYRAASALAPQHAAPLFGVYMVARATNNLAMADSALTGIRLRNGPMAPAPHSFTGPAMKRMHEGPGKKS